MWTESTNREELEIEGRQVKLSSCRISNAYIAEVTCSDLGTTIARAVAPTREEALGQVLDAAVLRLLRSSRLDPDYMVGG